MKNFFSILSRLYEGEAGRSKLFLTVLSLLLIGAYTSHATVAFDDLFLPVHFSNLARAHGTWHAAAIVFLGGDLALEYRTYGLSRLFQFMVWSLVGGLSFLYSLIISSMQAVTAFLLLSSARRAGISGSASLSIAVLWLISPFLTTWTFHHYSYLILPFQILIFGLFFFGRVAGFKRRYLVAFLLGIAFALTGEVQLPAVSLVLFGLVLFAKSPDCKKSACISIASFLVSLALHRLNWTLFVSDGSQPQRFAFRIPDSLLEKLLVDISGAAEWVYSSFIQQVMEISRSGVAAGLAFATLVVVAFLACVINLDRDRDRENSKDLQAAAALLFFAATSLSVYIAMAVLLEANAFRMPHRYGYVALTLMSISLTLFIGEFFRLLSCPDLLGKRVGHAIAIFIFAGLAGQFYIVQVHDERRSDKQLTSEVLRAKKDSENIHQGKKVALFFVASEEKYRDGPEDFSVIGPKTDTVERREFLESAWGIYWTAKLYVVNFLGFEHAGMTAQCVNTAPNGAKAALQCNLDGRTGVEPLSVDTRDVVVIANLGLEKLDPTGARIYIFESYENFEPNNFGRRIERNILQVANKLLDEIVIDLGRTTQEGVASESVLHDKRFENAFPSANQWIENYGLSEGVDSVHDNPGLRGDLASFRTNRHGDFSYRVDFKRASNVEIAFDFWEQWGRKPGERLFKLDVTWDGRNWVDVGVIDIAAINGERPFSLVLTRKSASMFAFRLSSVSGTKDIPVVQNLRISRF